MTPAGTLLRSLLVALQLIDFQVPRLLSWESEFTSKGYQGWQHILFYIHFSASCWENRESSHRLMLNLPQGLPHGLILLFRVPTMLSVSGTGVWTLFRAPTVLLFICLPMILITLLGNFFPQQSVSMFSWTLHGKTFNIFSFYYVLNFCKFDLGISHILSFKLTLIVILWI